MAKQITTYWDDTPMKQSVIGNEDLDLVEYSFGKENEFLNTNVKKKTIEKTIENHFKSIDENQYTSLFKMADKLKKQLDNIGSYKGDYVKKLINKSKCKRSKRKRKKSQIEIENKEPNITEEQKYENLYKDALKTIEQLKLENDINIQKKDNQLESKNETNEQKLSEIKEENKKQRQMVTLKQREITRLQKKLQQTTARNAELEISSKSLQDHYETKVINFKEQLNTITEQMHEKESKQMEIEKQLKDESQTVETLTKMLENHKKIIEEKNRQLKENYDNSFKLSNKLEELSKEKEIIVKKLNQLQEVDKNLQSSASQNLELAQRLFEEMKNIDKRVIEVMSINHNPALMQKQVQKQLEKYLAEKSQLLNENTLLRAKLQKLYDNQKNSKVISKSTKMETEAPDKLNRNLEEQNGNIDPRLQIFFDKFHQYKVKLDQYEQQKVEAVKEKDMWYDKSVQLEKQLQEFQNGNFASMKKSKSRKRPSNKIKNTDTCSDTSMRQQSINDEQSNYSQSQNSKKMEIEEPKPSNSLLFNFKKKSKNPFSTTFNSLKICMDCQLIIKKTDGQKNCMRCRGYLHEKCYNKKANKGCEDVNCRKCEKNNQKNQQNN